MDLQMCVFQMTITISFANYSAVELSEHVYIISKSKY